MLTEEEKKEIAEVVKVAVSSIPGGKRFTPGEDKNEADIKVIKDAGDQPWDRGFGQFLQAIAKAETGRGALDPRLLRVKATGLGEGIPSEGGFLVSQEFISKIMEKTWETGVVSAKCYRQPVGEGFNGVKIPAVNETSRVDGSRWGGVRAYWAAEGGTKTAAAPKFRQVSLELQKLIGLCYVTDELLQDAVGLESYVNRWFPLEFGFKMDDAVINGDGSGKPLGVMNGPCLVTISKETGQSATTVVAENIVKMWARLWAPARKNAVWLINQDVEPQLFTMSLAVGVGGVPVYMPLNGLSGAPYATLLGRPVIPIEQCATLGTTGDVILGDFGEYILIDKGGLQSASSIHVQFTTDETAFRFVYRVNGQPLWNSAVVPFKGSNSLSPFVTIETR